MATHNAAGAQGANYWDLLAANGKDPEILPHSLAAYQPGCTRAQQTYSASRYQFSGAGDHPAPLSARRDPRGQHPALGRPRGAVAAPTMAFDDEAKTIELPSATEGRREATVAMSNAVELGTFLQAVLINVHQGLSTFESAYPAFKSAAMPLFKAAAERAPDAAAEVATEGVTKPLASDSEQHQHQQQRPRLDFPVALPFPGLQGEDDTVEVPVVAVSPAEQQQLGSPQEAARAAPPATSALLAAAADGVLAATAVTDVGELLMGMAPFEGSEVEQATYDLQAMLAGAASRNEVEAHQVEALHHAAAIAGALMQQPGFQASMMQHLATFQGMAPHVRTLAAILAAHERRENGRRLAAGATDAPLPQPSPAPLPAAAAEIEETAAIAFSDGGGSGDLGRLGACAISTATACNTAAAGDAGPQPCDTGGGGVPSPLAGVTYSNGAGKLKSDISASVGAGSRFIARGGRGGEGDAAGPSSLATQLLDAICVLLGFSRDGMSSATAALLGSWCPASPVRGLAPRAQGGLVPPWSGQKQADGVDVASMSCGGNGDDGTVESENDDEADDDQDEQSTEMAFAEPRFRYNALFGVTSVAALLCCYLLARRVLFRS